MVVHPNMYANSCPVQGHPENSGHLVCYYCWQNWLDFIYTAIAGPKFVSEIVSL